MLYFSKWKIGIVLAIVFYGLLCALPNALSEDARTSMPGFLPNETLNLGLDLQGGAHLLLEVDMASVEQKELDTLTDEIRSVLREERIRSTQPIISESGVNVRIVNAEEAEAAFTAIKDLSRSVGAPGIGGLSGSTYRSAMEGDNTIRTVLTQDYLDDIKTRTIDQSVSVLRRRIDPSGTTEMTLARSGDSRVLLQVPGAKNVSSIKAVINDTALLTFHEVPDYNNADIEMAQAGTLKPGWAYMDYDEASSQSGGIIVIERPLLTGDDVASASQGFHPERASEPVVNFRFKPEGARIFGTFTAKNRGKLFAIALDGKVVTAPRVNSPILGGAGFIEGSYTIDSAQRQSLLINSGALPAKLTVVEERTVGPELGDASIKAGQMASMIGLVGVALFMLFSYGFRFGVFANIALATNILLIAGGLSLMQATLTLPGVAGIILTIGMAVDANVLIFERIREESLLGRPPMNAVETGYRMSLAPILDANITTLIAALVLYFVGSGPVQGFAVTLAIGIVTSVFTSVVVARLLTATWLRMARPKKLPI